MSLLQLFIVLSYIWIGTLGLRFGTMNGRASTLARRWGFWARVLEIDFGILLLGALLNARLLVAIRLMSGSAGLSRWEEKGKVTRESGWSRDHAQNRLHDGLADLMNVSGRETVGKSK